MINKCLKIKTYFHCRTHQQLAFKLDGLSFSVEKKSSSTSSVMRRTDRRCVFITSLTLAQGPSSREDSFKCTQCQWSGGDLLEECIQLTSAFYTTDNICVHEGKGYVVPSLLKVRPLCSCSKDVHLVKLFT